LLQNVADQQIKMLNMFDNILHGAKELRLNTRRSKAVSLDFAAESQCTEALLSMAGMRWISLILLSAIMMYSLLGIIGFVFPKYVDNHSSIIFQLVPTMLFCLAPLSKIVAQSPMFLRADIGLRGIFAMEDELDAAGGVTLGQAREESQKFQDFKQISFKAINYHYRDKAGEVLFTSGPWDLTINKGELLYLVGGNGSGKSTALRLISGLYRWDSGEAFVDGIGIKTSQYAGVRELFSTIFNNFHLFDRLYGLEHVSQEDVDNLIDLMELTDKVKYVDGRFSELHLSTGQRKRLALIVAILEDRPIYLFDEWSAEQDVHFREVFYTRILPDLKAKGKTVLVVTHDERFWHLADHVVKFELGKVESNLPGSSDQFKVK
jgi:putative ATP-binding cassette transporter